MDTGKIFCEKCRKDVSFQTREKQLETVIKRAKYLYTGKEVRCAECGNEIYTTEIDSYNLKMLSDVYREKKGIVSLHTILAIPQKYRIGKRPLSLLLGWGEQTFSRYYDGDIPTRQYSEILQRIYNDPRYYAELLENNKANLKSPVAYERSKKAVAAVIELVQSQEPKINQAIQYLLKQCEDITPLALQKALYYTQGFYYAFYKTFLFAEDCEAWIHGPVYKDVYYRYREYHFKPDEKTEEFDFSVLSSAEKAILDSIIKNICCYSGKTLETFTHLEEPWLSARREIPIAVKSGCIIQKETIGCYFSAVKEKYNMITPNDIRGYAQAMFEQL